MAFSYYNNLTQYQKRIYRRSDRIEKIALHSPSLLKPLVTDLQQALRAEDKAAVQTACQQLTTALVNDLAAPPVRIKVLATRPHDDYGELHGLYEPAEGRSKAQITLWMRTARRKRIVAFKTFLRTLLHELCHHLDYEFLRLEESFHTEGFFKREANLFRQIAD